MKPATKNVVRIVLAVLALAIGAILFGIVPVSVGFVRAPIESAVREATGLELSIGGPIILRLGPTPSISSGDLVLGDTASNPLLSVDSLRAKIGLFALLGGAIHVLEFTADGIRADYCSPLPTFSGEPVEDTVPPSVAVDAVELGRITVRCGPPEQADPMQIDIARVFAAAPADGPMRLDADVRVSGTDLTLTVTGGELDELLAGSRPFPVNASLVTATAVVEVSANLQTPPAEPAVDARVEIRSADVPSFAAAFGVSLPRVGALRAEGRVRTDFNNMQLVEITGELGDSRFVLDATVDLAGERKHVGLTATFEQLDLAPFRDNGAGAQSSKSVTGPGDVDLRPLLEMLHAFDADVQLTVTRVLDSPLALGGIEITASLANGLVEVRPLVAELLGGRMSATGSIDSRAECPEMKLLARGSGLDLATLNPLLALDEPIGGQIEAVDLESSSCGYSLSRHLDSLRVEADLTGGRLQIGHQLMPLATKQLHLSIMPGESSRARLAGELAGEQIEATLAMGSLEALLGPETWPFDFEFRGAGSRLRLDGHAGFAAGNATLDASLEFEVPRIGTLHAWTATSPEATLPLRATARLRVDETSVAADSTAMSLGRSDLGGSAVWRYGDEPAILELTLRSSLLDFDEIVSALAPVMVQTEAVSAVANDGGAPLIPAGFTLPPVDLDINLDAINLRRLDLQEFDVSGRLRHGLIDDARVSVILEDDVLLRGKLDLDLRSSPAEGALQVAADNVDIGKLLRKLDVADDLLVRADGLVLAVTTEGETPMQFLLNALLEADLQGFYWNIPADDSTQGGAPRKAFDLSLAHLQLTTGPDQRTIWASSGQVDGAQLEIWMETPSLTDTFGDSPELPLTLVAAAGDNVVMLETRIDRSADAGFLAHVLLSGQVVDSEDRVLAKLESPLADYELRSDIILIEDHLALPDIQMRLGSSTVNGSFAVAGDGERRHFDIMLHAPHLQTDDLLYWTSDFREAAVDAKEQPADGIVGGDTDEPQREFLSIVSDYIDEFRKSDDLDLSITVDDLRSGTDHLGSAELGFYLDEDDFILRPVKIQLPGGEVDAQYMWKIADGRFDGSLKVHVEAFRYGGLLRLADHDSEARGILYLDTELSASTNWSPDTAPFDLLLNNADGSVSLAVWPENAEAGLLDIWTANLVLALLPTSPSKDATLLNCMVARLDVEDGVMQTGVAILDSTDTIFRGRGEIDFARQELELLVAPQAKREKFLSMSTPVMVTGPFDDFQIGVEPGGLFAMAMKWWMNLIYVPYKWLTGERFPADGTSTCFNAMDWELTPELQEYFLQRDFSVPPPLLND